MSSIIMGAELNAVVLAGAQAIMSNYVEVAGGSFQMGTNSLSERERPVHEVVVPPFSMSKYEATIGDHQALLDRLGDHRVALLAGPSGRNPRVVALGKNANAFLDVSLSAIFDHRTVGDLLESSGHYVFSGLRVVDMNSPEIEPKLNHPKKPMILQNFFQQVAHAFLHGARLASEREWEFVATSGGRFKCGTASGYYKPEEANFNSKATTEVGSYPPNALGFFDMAGNVGERLLDWFEPYSSEAVIDSRFWPQADMYRVIRGGSFSDTWNCSDLLLAASRCWEQPGLGRRNLGFRLVAHRQESPV